MAPNLNSTFDKILLFLDQKPFHLEEHLKFSNKHRP